MAEMKADTSAETLAQVMAGHAALMWGPARSEDLHGPLVRTAQAVLDIRRRLPGLYTEPGCYPAADSSGTTTQK